MHVRLDLCMVAWNEQDAVISLVWLLFAENSWGSVISQELYIPVELCSLFMAQH
jgi:hypothetical protein